MTDALPVGILELLKFYYNQKKEGLTPPPQTYLCDLQAWEIIYKNNSNCCKISRKLFITENDYSNVAGATLPKSLSPVDILLLILQEFRNIFLKEHIRKAAEATFTYFNCTWLYIQTATRGVL